MGSSKYLEGAVGDRLGGRGITELAKEIATQVKALKKPEIKGGAVEGVVVGPEQVDDITKLPSREVLIAQVISLLLGPRERSRSCRRRRPRWSASSRPLPSGSKAKGARRRLMPRTHLSQRLPSPADAPAGPMLGARCQPCHATRIQSMETDN